MEASGETEQQQQQQQQTNKIDMEKCAGLTLAVFDEDYPLKNFNIYGKKPCLQIDLKSAHFIYVQFIKIRNLLTACTEAELLSMMTEMEPFQEGGVRLDFYKDFKLVRVRYVTQTSLSKFLNVYKYDTVIASLCPGIEISEYSMEDIEEEEEDSDAHSLCDDTFSSFSDDTDEDENQ